MGQTEYENLNDVYAEPGFGSVCPDPEGVRILSAVKPGQDIVVAGYIGLAGTIWLARHKEETLLRTLPWDYVDAGRALLEYIEMVPEAAVAGRHGAAAMHFVTEGGIFGALWELAQAADTGMYTRLKDIPVKQHTIEFCEIFDLNPYQLLSGGCLLLVTENGCDTIFRLTQAGIPCTVIGKITGDRKRVVAHDDTCRYLTRPQKDELYRVLPAACDI